MTDTAHERNERLRDELLHHRDLPFTAGHLKWLANGSKVTPEAFQRIMRVQLQDHFKTNRADGSGRLRASGFSTVGYPNLEYCPRRHILSFLGLPQDVVDTGAIEMMNTGTHLHYYLQQAGLSAGWLADIEVPVHYEPWYLRGSMDGLMADGSGLEIKTTGSPIFSKVDKKKKELEAARKPIWKAASLSHLWQIHMYMQAADLDKFSLVYIDRGWPSRFLELRVPRDDQIMEDVAAAMDELVDYITAKELPPMLESCQRQTGKTYDGCPFRSYCPEAKEFP